MPSEVLSTKDARTYLVECVGDLAPALRTLQNWARPAWRRENAPLVKAAKIPAPAKLAGMRRVAWARSALDAWVDQLAAQAKQANRKARR